MIGIILHRWLRLPYTLHVDQIKSVKKPRARLLFIHGIGSSGEGWHEVISRLPDDVSVMTVDLLGFGESPKPKWAKYDVATQAKSIIATLVKLRLTKRVIIVGHSLGSLVAVEVTKRYPILVKSLVLCSPPLYDAKSDKNSVLRRIFKAAKTWPDEFLYLAKIAKKYKLVDAAINITEDNFHSYMATLRASILTQTSLQDVQNIDKPITLLAGATDPWLKKRNLKTVTANNKRAKLITTLAGHEVKGRYVGAVVDAIKQHIV